MIQLEAHSDGVLLIVRAQPGASRDEIRGEQHGALKVAVTQSPEKGKANQALIALLAETLHLRKSQFQVLSGQTSRLKRILVHGITVEALQTALNALI